VCGGLFPGDTRFSVGGQFAKGTIAAKWTAGSTVEIAVQVWTNHVSVISAMSCADSTTSVHRRRPLPGLYARLKCLHLGCTPCVYYRL
jgi:hypothetical protein